MSVTGGYDLKNSGIYFPFFRHGTDFMEYVHGNVCAVPVIVANAADVVSRVFGFIRVHMIGLRLNVDVGRTFDNGPGIKLPPDSSHWQRGPRIGHHARPASPVCSGAGGGYLMAKGIGKAALTEFGPQQAD